MLIHAYILEHFDPSNYGEDPDNFNTFEDVSVYVWRVFTTEYRLRDSNTLRYYKTLQNAFESWLRGLPSVLDPAFLYHESAVDVLGSWLQETEEEKSKYTESQAEDYILRLIYREISGAIGGALLYYPERVELI